ncbi:MarR family winged helix-turn-helix transcriptional regulator [Luteimonas wenzhouensis]|uniref:MarR family transcriptional regulator n=1 Tax=Luteimonas wenzhouensis TaxID=2599615 RepID=A0A5C5TUJ3_9GAMM|nr:MarR family transcriptional regulator [Luteimonas wenzhouensis]TWT16875.1 MarR family transcriptional regulator [Luteimonas wenzhouensis]
MARKHPSTRQPPDPREGLVDTLVTASFVVMAVISRLGAAHDLSLSMVRMLGILRDRRPRMTELADYLGLEKQTMSGLVARAEKRGLVARVPNEDDARATDVVLTDEGARLLRQLRAEGRAALGPLVENLDASEQQLARDLLQRLFRGRRD